MTKKRKAFVKAWTKASWAASEKARAKAAAKKSFVWHGYKFSYELGFPDDGTGGGGMAAQYTVNLPGSMHCAGLSENPEQAKHEFVEWLLTKRVRGLQEEATELAARAGEMLKELNAASDNGSRPYWRDCGLD